MLLRSSSTPILGSLLSSYSEKDFENIKNPNSDHHHHIKKISFSHGSNLNFTSFSCNSSNSISGFSDSDQDFSSRGVFRRVQSDGNLEGLVVKSCDDIEEFKNSKLPPLRSLRRSSSSMLQTVPSFAIFNSISGFEEDEEEEEERESGFNEKDGVLGLGRSITIGDNIMAIGNDGFSFGESKMGLIEEDERMNNFQYLGVDEDGQPMSPPMFLARGLGMDFGGGGGGGGDFNPMKLGEGVQDEANSGEYYKKMVEENPCSPLVLRNYAQFLYKTKGDLRGAEEYYARAILADPQDGEILSQYAKLVWELHRDHELASSYYERSVQASPQDSHVHAAYASFLWETEEEEKEEEQDSLLPQSLLGIATFHEGAMASATA